MADAIVQASPPPHRSLPIAIAEARQLQQAGDWAAALVVWKEVHSNYPGAAVAIVGLGTVLRILKRYDEADLCYATGLDQFPEIADIVVGYARVAVGRLNWRVAADRWKAALDRFPNEPAAAAGLATALQQLRRPSEAESVLRVAREKFPSHWEVMTAYAGLAAAIREWPVALQRWQETLQRYPEISVAHVGAGVALRELFRLDEADKILSIAADRFPADPNVLINFARVAAKRRDWPEALRRWELVRRNFGEIDAYVRGHGWVMSTVQIERLDLNLSQTANAALAQYSASAEYFGKRKLDVPANDAAAILAKFESLGDNCEFGFVQRYAKAEPMGLLRWANLPTKNLLALLRTRFDGVGEAEFTHTYPEVDGEIWVMDRRYDMRTHTFVFEADVSGARKERFRELMCARFRFLKNQLIRDLEAGSKIFIFKSNESISDEEVDAVYSGVSEYGANWLLHVRSAGMENSAGSVRLIRDRLLVGYVRTKGPLDHDGWRDVCRAALVLRDTAGMDPARVDRP